MVKRLIGAQLMLVQAISDRQARVEEGKEELGVPGEPGAIMIFYAPGSYPPGPKRCAPEGKVRGNPGAQISLKGPGRHVPSSPSTAWKGFVFLFTRLWYR